MIFEKAAIYIKRYIDYSKIYNSIVARAKLESRDKRQGYFEKHHILPKSLGGNNEEENLVLLTAKEHYLVHMLLVEMYPRGSYEWQKMVYAASMFLAKSKYHGRENISARFYSRIRKTLSEIRTGIPRSEEVKEKIKFTKASNPRVFSKEEKEKASERMKGNQNPMFGKTHTEGVKAFLRQLKKGKKNPRISESNKQRKGKILTYTRQVEQCDLSGRVLSTYISIAEAKRQTGITSIAGVLGGKWTTAGGFYWKYKNDVE